MAFLFAMAFIASAAALWFGLRAHDLNNAVTTQARTIVNLDREVLQTQAERQVAISTHQRIMEELRKDPSNPYYVPPVTPQVARRKQRRGCPEGPRGIKGEPGKYSESNAKSSAYNSSRQPPGSDAAILATTAAVATYSGYDSGSSYCDSGSSSFDSSCSF